MSIHIEELIKETCKDFEEYYWKSREITYSGTPGAYIQKVPEKEAGFPLVDLAHYIVDARKEQVKKFDACYYGGTKLLFAVLERTNRRWSRSVEEANNLFSTGKKTSEYLWDLLDKYGDSKKFWKEIHRLTRGIKKCYKAVVH